MAVTRLPEVPTGTSLAATVILSSGATLNSSVNPGGYADAFFQLGTSTNSGLVVSTMAGSATAGSADGTGAAAQFNSPLGVAVDASGNVYVADSSNNSLRKITPAGVVTTLAGSGTAGFADGTGASAQFDGLSDVAVDSDGNVYVADSNNNRIRKVSPAGNVTTLAGSGTAGFADGTGASARFKYPLGLTVDAQGTVYVADMSNHRIRKVSPVGNVTTLAGSGTAGFVNGTGTAALLNSPSDVALDAAGNVYVSEYWNHSIRKVSPAGEVTALAGSGTAGFVNGTGAGAQFTGPYRVAVDAGGNVYVADLGNYRIRKVTPGGDVTTWAGLGQGAYSDGPVAGAYFGTIQGLSLADNGTAYVADASNNRIRKIAQVTSLLALAQSGLAGTNPVPASLVATGLLPETTYYYRA
ncbi:MAG: NHL repeat-containing protein, partial [Verrucomicrobia bacterium]|nr:NHL repeat-containing protein [Verrucomicrobiota bacterium]